MSKQQQFTAHSFPYDACSRATIHRPPCIGGEAHREKLVQDLSLHPEFDPLYRRNEILEGNKEKTRSLN